MHRKKILELIEKYSPIFEEELQYKQQISQFIHNHPLCFERSLEVGHITASSWLLDVTQTKALLLHHTKLRIWCQPGGHCDGNSDPLQVAIQEAKEETGVIDIAPIHTDIFDIDIHKIPSCVSTKEHLHYDIRFLLAMQSKTDPCLNAESTDFLWIDKKTIPPTRERSILRMREKWTFLS